MGHRSNYVIIRDGAVELYTSRCGGAGILADLRTGPAAASDVVRDRADAQPTGLGALLPDGRCAGAALIDHDRRVLLAFQYTVDYRAFVAGFNDLVLTWPGWQVRWAFDGIGDIAAYLGLDRSTVREPTAPDRYPMGLHGPDDRPAADRPTCVLSVRREDGSLGLYSSGHSPGELRCPDPAVFDHLSAGLAELVCAEIPRAGIHLDHRYRSVGVWSIDPLRGFLDSPRPDRAGWVGWYWQLWGSAIREQLVRCAGRLVVPPLPLRLQSGEPRLKVRQDHAQVVALDRAGGGVRSGR